MAEDDVRTCDLCGATIYDEHLESNAARRVGGKLLCPVCVAERQTATGNTLIERETKFRRPLDAGSPYATRCKTFHAKMSDASINHLDELVNEWVDAHDGVVIKFATTTVGTVEGKHNDLHLIITLFY